MNLKIMGYVDTGPQQVSAIGQCLKLSASYGHSWFLTLPCKRREGRREVGKVNFSKFVYLPVKRRVVARLDKRGTSVVGAGLDILGLKPPEHLQGK